MISCKISESAKQSALGAQVSVSSARVPNCLECPSSAKFPLTLWVKNSATLQEMNLLIVFVWAQLSLKVGKTDSDDKVGSEPPKNGKIIHN